MTTPLESPTSADTRTLTLTRAVFLGVGAMVGAGIFALLGEAGKVAGAAVWLSFLVGGFICLFQGYSFAKLGARYPSRGGTIEYILQGFGKGHITGSTAWLLMLTLIIVAAMVAVSFGSYGSSLFFGEDANPIIAKILAAAVIVVITLVNTAGSSAVARLSSLVVVTLAVLLVFSVAGLSQADPALLDPATYPAFRKVLASVALTFFAFLGFGVIAFSADDIKDPAKNLGRAMYAAIVIATVTYVAIALAVYGTLTLDEVIAAGDNALAVAAEPIFGQLGFTAVSLVALLATSSALNSNLYAATGASKQLGSNGLLPPLLGRPVGNGGSMGLVIAGVLTIVVALTLDLTAIASLGSAVSLVVFILASLAHLRVIDQTGARALLVWLAVITAALTFVAFVFSTFIDSPSTIVLIIVFVIAAVVLDVVWSRVRGQASSAPATPA
jgi:amino acid transporter